MVRRKIIFLGAVLFLMSLFLIPPTAYGYGRSFGTAETNYEELTMAACYDAPLKTSASYWVDYGEYIYFYFQVGPNYKIEWDFSGSNPFVGIYVRGFPSSGI